MGRLTLHERSVWLVALLGSLAMGAGVATSAWSDLKAERVSVARDVGVHADVTADQIAAALQSTADPERLVRAILAALEAERSLLSAVVHQPSGEPWTWKRGGLGRDHVVPTLAPDAGSLDAVGQYLEAERVVTVRSLPFPGGTGRLVLEGSFESVALRRVEWAGFGVRCVAIGGVLLYLVAGLLLRRLFAPVERLGRAAKHVVREGKSGQRLDEKSAPELASLAVAFNNLLGALELRDEQLACVREDFELELEARTAELTALNDKLSRSQAMAQAAADTKAEFLANMSHEIRTPMNAVIGMTSLLMDTQLDAEQRALAEKVRRSGEGLLEIINDILDFSKIEAGKLELEETAFDPREVLEEAVDMVSQAAQEKGIELASFVHPDVPDQVIGDPGRLRQVLLNFLGNAAKFTDDGEVVATASLEAEDARHAVLRLSVRDTGTGIPDDRQATLFETFTQGDASTTRRYGGTGLGLAISQRLVRLMGGGVEFQSMDGVGSTFGCRLRFRKPEGVEQRAPSPQGLQGRRVLVVQENAAVADVLAAQLSNLGCVVEVEHSAYRAFELLRREGGFELVLLDSQVPGRDAFLSSLASQKASEAARVVLLAPLFQRKGLPQDPRVVAHLDKPVKQQQLVETLCSALGVATAEKSEEADGESTDNLVHTGLRERFRILLAEDNDTNQQLVQYLLGKRGYRVDVAANGRKAVDVFAVGDYDLILMDCQMPEMDGFEATGRIRELEQVRGTHVPILAMTANALQGDRNRCLAAGMDDYIAKPIKPREFVAWLEGWIQRSVGGRELTSRSDPQPAREAPPRPADPAPLDRDVLGCLLEDDEDSSGPELALELVDHYLRFAPDELAALEEAAEEEDWELCGKLAHDFVSSCGTVGAVRFAAVLRRIESACSRSPQEEVPSLVRGLREELQATVAALQELGG